MYASALLTKDHAIYRRSGTVVAVDLDIIIRQIAAPGRSSVLTLVNVNLNGDFVCGENLLCKLLIDCLLYTSDAADEL